MEKSSGLPDTEAWSEALQKDLEHNRLDIIVDW